MASSSSSGEGEPARGILARVREHHRKAALLDKLRAWKIREDTICFVEGGYWGRDELYQQRAQELADLEREAHAIDPDVQTYHSGSGFDIWKGWGEDAHIIAFVEQWH